MSNPEVRPHPQVILTEMSDGTAVLLHLETKFFFTLNPTALYIYKSLTSGSTRQQVSDLLVNEFEVEAQVAERDIKTLLDGLIAEQLLLQGP